MRHTSARATAAAAAAALLLAGCGSIGGDDRAAEARAVGVAFLADWAAGRIPAAAARTTDANAAAVALNDLQDTLRPDTRTLTAGEVSGCEDEAPCVLAFDATLALDALGDWAYGSALTLVETAEPAEDEAAWRVQWAPSVIHPKLTDRNRLSRSRSLPARASILDRDGAPLVSDQPVVRVGVAAGRVPDGTIEAIADITDVVEDGLRTRTEQAENGQFVQAIVLREDAYEAIESELDEIGGVVTQEDTLPLAPSPEFARAVLGVVGQATKEALDNAGPTASSVDSVGTSGLQELYQKQLAGRPGGRVELVNASTDAPEETLVEFEEVAGVDLRTTLDVDIQQAAQAAVALTDESSSLVAIDTTTGDILAVANGPAGQAGDERALDGEYAPGSTFKIITTAALLADGLEVDDTVSCPPTVNVEGREFENYDGLGSLGDVSFRTDFTQSCNTAFIAEAVELGPEALADAAETFGIGGAWDIGLNSFSGDVPPSNSDVDQAAAAIGQGRVLMSPLAMASVAAAVASGTPRYPRLLLDGPPPEVAPTATPDPAATAASSPEPDEFRPELEPLADAETLRELMFETVRSGTATVVSIPGEQVGAKTGTAEYGSETEPGKHAWLVGFVDEIAFAVIVERGDTGARTAGPLARAFLTAVS